MALLLQAARKLSRPLQVPFPSFHRLSTDAHQPKAPSFMSQYLITSFGFSPDRAQRVASSPVLSAIKSHDRPQAVVGFLKETGLTDPQIKRLVSWSPLLLGHSVSNVLQPHVGELIAGGFVGETLARLIQTCPSILLLRSALPRLQFWRGFAGSDEEFLKIIRRNHRLVQQDIEEVVLPTIDQLKGSGFSDGDVRKLYLAMGDVLKGPEFVKRLIEDTEALGFDRKSRMFISGLIVMGNNNRETIKKKFEFFRNKCGWSDDEVRAAFKRFPNMVCLSEKTLQAKIEFLTGTAGIKKAEIVSAPDLLGYSMEKRLLPRHCVISLLKLKDLNCVNFRSVIKKSDLDFFNKFVKPYRNQVPELEEVFAASCEAKMSS